jgi:hypothetical protein
MKSNEQLGGGIAAVVISTTAIGELHYTIAICFLFPDGSPSHFWV